MKIEIHRNSESQPWTYSQLDLRQRELAQNISQGGEATLLLSELAPVITRGRRTPLTDLLPASPVGNTEVLNIDRGGLATYHGPGQWVAFPIHRLEDSAGDSRGVHKIICKLLGAAAEVGRLYCEDVEIRSGAELGVWNAQGKFAAAGVHIENGILLHGIAINGFRTPQSFVGLRPCGLDLPVSYLLNEANEDRFSQLGTQIIDALSRALAPAHSKQAMNESCALERGRSHDLQQSCS